MCDPDPRGLEEYRLSSGLAVAKLGRFLELRSNLALEDGQDALVKLTDAGFGKPQHLADLVEWLRI
jgi:hypothetical protein